MKHGHSCDIQIWWPSVENIAPGLRSRGTFSTSVHHIWMSHSLLCIICIMLCGIFIIFSDSNFVSVAIWWKTRFSKIGFRCSQNCYLMDNIIISGRIACITWKRPIANMSHVLWSVCLCVRYRSGTGLCKSGWTDRQPVWWAVFCEPIGPRNHVLDEVAHWRYFDRMIRARRQCYIASSYIDYFYCYF